MAHVKTVFMVAGEASADLHASQLLRELRQKDPTIRGFGVGGKRLSAEGFEAVVDASDLNVVGLSDWLGQAKTVVGSYRKVVSEIKRRSIDVAVLLDLPDFNLGLVRHLKKKQIPVVYYISPQIWAWRQYRIRTIRKHVDEMLVVFPFEEKFYRERGVSARFVGHPLVQSVAVRPALRSVPEIRLGPRVAILPGSRRSEIRFHGPLVAEVVRNMRRDFPACEIRVPVAPTLQESELRASIGDGVTYDRRPAVETLHWADAALVASGTATLETALTETPFCLFYRMAPFSAFALKFIVRYRNFLGMPNLLLGEEAIREFIQEGATPHALGDELRRLLFDNAYRENGVSRLRRCRQLLSGDSVTETAAERVAAHLL